LARAQYLYYRLRDYAGALTELEIARRALPNDPRLFELTGYILRRRGSGGRSAQPAARGGAGSRNRHLNGSAQLPNLALAEASLLDRALAIVPDNAERRPIVDYFISAGKRTRGLHQTIDATSRKDRAPSPPPRTSGSIALWPNAIGCG
jgi:hypothetical protein